MQQFLASYTATDLLAILVGAALLVSGRRLYWLALGGVGFFLGLWLAGQVLRPGASGLELGIGFLVGILCAWLAVAVRRLAVGLAGFFIGGVLAYWAASWAASSLGWQGPWPAAAAICGAMLGTLFAAVLFEASLIALTCLFGASLVVHASHAGAPREGWLLLILICTGAIVQSGRRRRGPDRRLARQA